MAKQEFHTHIDIWLEFACHRCLASLYSVESKVTIAMTSLWYCHEARPYDHKCRAMPTCRIERRTRCWKKPGVCTHWHVKLLQRLKVNDFLIQYELTDEQRALAKKLKATVLPVDTHTSVACKLYIQRGGSQLQAATPCPW
eukprot:4657354-Amphidinium_carterae.1